MESLKGLRTGEFKIINKYSLENIVQAILE